MVTRMCDSQKSCAGMNYDVPSLSCQCGESRCDLSVTTTTLQSLRSMKATPALAIPSMVTREEAVESSATVDYGDTVRDLALQLRNLSGHLNPPSGAPDDV